MNFDRSIVRFHAYEKERKKEKDSTWKETRATDWASFRERDNTFAAVNSATNGAC